MFFDFLLVTVPTFWGLRLMQTDLREFRISNRSLFFGFFLIWPIFILLNQKFRFDFIILFILSTAILLGYLNLIGMGDAKLLVFFAPWLQRDRLIETIFALLIFAWIQLLIIFGAQRAFPQRIALAPAILLAAGINMAT